MLLESPQQLAKYTTSTYQTLPEALSSPGTYGWRHPSPFLLAIDLWVSADPPDANLAGRFGAESLQLTMTVYAVIAVPIVSPIIVVSLGFGVFALSIIEITVEIIIEEFLTIHGDADRHA